MTEFLTAMAVNALFALWALSAFVSGCFATALFTIRRHEWDELPIGKKVSLPLVIILCSANALAFVTYLTESSKAAGC